MKKGGFVYIICSPNKSVLYVGITADLCRRVWEHRNKLNPDCFTAKYNCSVLVYYCFFERIEDAIAEEKRIKGGSRKKKMDLIFGLNPEMKDLFESVCMV